MFVYKDEIRVWRPVTINVPVDGGGVSPFTMHARFKLLDDAEVNERMRSTLELMKASLLGDQGDLSQLLASLDDKEYQKRVDDVVGRVDAWKDIVVECDGVEVPLEFSQEKLRAVLAKSYALAAYSQELVDASKGIASKNLDASPASGQAAANQTTSDSTT